MCGSAAEKVHQAERVARWSPGTFTEGMGVNETEGLISSNHNKGRGSGPSRLKASERELLCWKIKSLSTQTVSLIPTVQLLLING